MNGIFDDTARERSCDDDGLAERVIALLVSVLERPRERIHPRSSFDELGIDSLTALLLVAEVENAFEIEISSSDLVHLRSVADVITTIRARLA